MKDSDSALDVVMSVQQETGANRIVFDKKNIAEDFFKLSSGLAGDILEKFITYRFKVAIVGDYSCYTSKPLHDFMYESNIGNDIFFVTTKEDAIDKLAKAK